MVLVRIILQRIMRKLLVNIKTNKNFSIIVWPNLHIVIGLGKIKIYHLILERFVQASLRVLAIRKAHRCKVHSAYFDLFNNVASYRNIWHSGLPFD